MGLTQNIEVRVRGTVQGVGFRPTVWRLAHDHDLVGEVHNDTDGVLIRLCGEKSKLSNFLTDLNEKAPPLAKIDTIEVLTIQQGWDFESFSIRCSSAIGGQTEVSGDAATCNACLEEIFNPDQRRYLYPFTNCTHCGPRLSIVQGIPYDRAQTTMSNFPMCNLCKQEYGDPADRRFHAQPIACHKCGPRVYLEATNSPFSEPAIHYEQNRVCDPAMLSNDKLDTVHQYLSQGLIVAIRGIGGFHLCCDATNNSAVARLRERKHRYAKPFALMSHTLDAIEQYCTLSEIEKEQLRSPQAPIVLLLSKENSTQQPPKNQTLSSHIAPGSNLLGFMLPYTPLHWLISKRFAKPLVMTSGNLSHQPQVTDNKEAINKLADIADVVLYHDRDIANRIDDSVVRCMAGKARILRRARGYAPRSFRLPSGFENSPDLLAYGGELKSTFCLLKQGAAVVSQHQGDLEDLDTYNDYENNLALYAQLFEHQPSVLVADKHPEYLSTKLAKREMNKQANKVQLIQVQHHHAHIASCLVENNTPLSQSKVLGIAMDGLGFGEDGTLWGGEFMVADYCDKLRVAHFKPVAMIGGAQAIREPWRNTYAHILAAMPWQQFTARFGDTDIGRFLNQQPLLVMQNMLERQINVPKASSCGRLFDAVTAAVGICREKAHFEGQGAIEFESRVDAKMLQSGQVDHPYPFDIESCDKTGLPIIEPRSMWFALLQDLADNTALTTIANRFHAGLINIIADMAHQLLKQHKLNKVALSGGCMQNRFLLEGLSAKLQTLGYDCISHATVPSNDGGISLGQAAVAAARIIKAAQNKTKQQINGSN